MVESDYDDDDDEDDDGGGGLDDDDDDDDDDEDKKDEQMKLKAIHPTRNKLTWRLNHPPCFSREVVDRKL